jgi:hypothetical protein
MNDTPSHRTIHDPDRTRIVREALERLLDLLAVEVVERLHRQDESKNDPQRPDKAEMFHE